MVLPVPEVVLQMLLDVEKSGEQDKECFLKMVGEYRPWYWLLFIK